MPASKKPARDEAAPTADGQAPAPAVDLSPAQNTAPSAPAERRVLLVYTGDPGRVVSPFGELSPGEVVAAPARLVPALLTVRLFTPWPLDESVPDDVPVRHP